MFSDVLRLRSVAVASMMCVAMCYYLLLVLLGFVVCVGMYVLLSAGVVGPLSLFWFCLCVLLLFIVFVSGCFVALRLKVCVRVLFVVCCVIYCIMSMLLIARC